MSTLTNERRAVPRQDTATAVRVRAQQWLDYDNGVLLDMSETGVRFFLSRSIELGAKVSIAIDSADPRALPRYMLAQVVRVDRSNLGGFTYACTMCNSLNTPATSLPLGAPT